MSGLNKEPTKLVSIHAPVMDAIISVSSTIKRQSFNPRARDGRDYLSCQKWHGGDCFNPRARDGRDLSTLRRRLRHYRFQSTRP